MNEKNINFSDYTVSLRIGDSVKFIDMDFLAVICDKFLFEEVCDLLAQSPAKSLFYSSVRNKTRFVLQIYPKETNECPVS